MKLHWTASFKVILCACLLSQYVSAQDQSIPTFDDTDSLQIVSKDTEVLPPDTTTIPEAPFFSAISIKWDYGKTIGLVLEREDKYEGALEFVFRDRFILALEGGFADLRPRRAFENADYNVRGVYGRVGFDYRLNPRGNFNTFAGVRYGRAFFDEEGTFFINNSLFNQFQETFVRNDQEAEWFEIVIGSESDLIKNVRLGFNLRLKFLNGFENFEPIELFTIPGFGLTSFTIYPALNLYARYTINFF